MVNLTILEQISRLISTVNAKSMIKWSNRFTYGDPHKRSWYLKKLVKKVKQILELVSGNDIINMLKGQFFYKKRYTHKNSCKI
jgi:hypothetical protein